MRNCRAPRYSWSNISRIVAGLSVVLAVFVAAPASAQKLDVDQVLSAIVKVTAEVPADARTARVLGTQREGSGVVIDDDGLVLTVGYLILESMGAQITAADGRAVPAKFVAYDHDSGLGLLRATKPLGVKPLPLGDSKPMSERDRVLVASFGGRDAALGAFVVSRREFAGSWEYLLENAIFTAPPHIAFGGAALIDPNGSLVGIGSLIVPNAAAKDTAFPGNMFIPIDALKPILGDLLARGRSSIGPRPWLGVYPEEHQGRVFVVRVPPGGPGANAGLKPGDIILGVGDRPVTGLADYYRKMWSLGKAGITVPLTILRDSAPGQVKVKSIDRYDWLKMHVSY